MQRRSGRQPGWLAWSPRITALVLFLFLVCAYPQSNAQAIWAEAGTSTMMRASGFQMNYHWAPVQGWLSAGWQDGFTFGGFVQTKVHQYDVGIGDRYQPLVIDTDVFDQSRYFAGRGISLQR